MVSDNNERRTKPHRFAHDYRSVSTYPSTAQQYAYPSPNNPTPPIFTCGTSTWKLCLSVLATTVAVEIVFVLLTGLHLYHGVMFSGQTEGLPGLGGGWDPKTNTTLYPRGPIHFNPFKTTTPPAVAEKPPDQFLKEWEAFCLKKVVPVPTGAEPSQLCPCIPRHLRE